MTREKDCRWKDFCEVCENIRDKEHRCWLCLWYRPIDTAYGYCFLLPEPVEVAWCKDPCSFYKLKRENLEDPREAYKRGLKEAYLHIQLRIANIQDNLDYSDQGMREFRSACLQAIGTNWKDQLKEWLQERSPYRAK